MSEEIQVKEVTLPLGVEELKEFIENKGKFLYLCDYSKLELKGTVLYNYISNLELPVEFSFENSSFEEKQEAIKSFMETRNIIKADSLRLTVASIILYARGIKVDEVFENMIFSNDEKKEFFQNNLELCSKWEQFLESTMIYAQKCVSLDGESGEEKFEFEHDFEVIDDVTYVGSNIIMMFSIPSFMELFFLTGSRTKLMYFKQQFDEYIFRGKNLYDYYFCEENEVFQMFLAQATGKVSLDELNRVTEYVETTLVP